jgi:N12 class adenine-specific DNA methylase
VPSADAQLAPDAQGSTAADRHVVGENYRITDADPIGEGGQKGKADANMAAIRVLKQIEDEGRPATRAEQAVLVRYVGWGGIPQIFRDLTTGKVRTEWRTRAEELESLLTPDELAAARASTTNAHYTAPGVIRAMFGALEHLGFTGGRILEPALGVGHFLGMTPDGMAGAVTWHGTELDSLSGRIAKQLYPRADIRVQGFEEMRVPDNFFDAAIGNPPFGSTQLADPRYDKHKFLIHDYFFAKSLDTVRPGGVLLYITSHGTMDKTAAKARRYIAERADLLGAVRLPSSAFEKNAMTSVTTDILVFQKREPDTAPGGEAFAAIGTHTNSRGETVQINEYFVKHPEMMLGVMSMQGTMRRGGGQELTLEPLPGLDMETALAEALAKLPANVWSALPASTNATAPITQAAALATSDALPETFAVRDGVLVQSRDGVWAPAGFKDAATTKRVTALVALRESVNTILGTQQQGASDAEIDAAIAAGRKRYTAFTREYGPILKTVRTVTKKIKKDGTPVITERRPNLASFVDDPLWYRVLTLEAYDAESNTAKPSQLLEGPVMGVQTLPDRFDNAIDALRAVMTTRGMVDVPWMAQRTDLTETQVVEQLRGRIFENPQTGRYETAAKYLSGNVREKLAIAQAALDERPELKGNVAALKDALPKDILPTDISASLGAAWIPADTIKAFIGHLFPYHGGIGQVRINSLGGTNYSVTLPSAMEYAEESRTKWGTDDMWFSKLLEVTLNQKTPVIRKPNGNGGTYLDLTATELAKARQTQLRDEWARWLMADDARAEALSRLYNDRFNVWAPAVFDGSDLQFPGAVSYYKGKPFQLKPHQKNAVARYLENGNLYLGHVVGAGKTFTAAAIAIEARRLGLAKKPMIVTPNHMLAQWTTEFLAMYPTAKLLVADAEAFAVSERGAFVAKAASQEWDAIIIKSTAFFKLPVSRERQESLIEEEVKMLLEAKAEMKKGDAKGNRNGIKELEARIKALRVKLKRLAAEERKDDAFTFEETGTDLLIVDEAHEYKNLFLISGIQNLSIRGSDRAYDMYLKTRVLHEVNPGRGLVFMSGTPISNSFGELFTLQRYLQPQILESLGITRFDAWVATFAQPTTSQEKTATGKYKPKTRYRKFQNVPELRGMYSQVLDVKTQEHLQLPRPALIGGQPEVVVAPGSEALTRYVKRLAKRAEMLKPGKPQKGADNFLSITNDGRIAGLDVRLVDHRAPDDPSSKVNRAVEKIAEIYKESTPDKGVQLVFLDLSTPGSELTDAAFNRGGQGINIYDDMRAKLIKAGIPASEIGFAQDFKQDEQKAKFFADLKSGRKRVAFASTQLMGAGTNVQDRLVALHRLDVPWKPSDLEQSEGRILRQGNLLYNDGLIPGIRILRYVTRGSYDEQIWGMVLGKQRMVASVLSGDSTARTIEDADEVTLSYQQAMAAATDNPLFLEKIELDMKIASLEMLASAHAEEQRGMRSRRASSQSELERAKRKLANVQADLATRLDTTGAAFSVQVGEATLTKRADAAKALKNVIDLQRKAPKRLAEETQEPIGRFAGFPLEVRVFKATEERTNVYLMLVGAASYYTEIEADQTEAGILASLEHVAKNIDRSATHAAEFIEQTTQRLRQLETSIGAPFNQRDELAAAKERRTAVEEELAKEPPKPEAPATEATDEESEDADDDTIEEDDGAEEDDGEERFAYTDPIAALIGESLRRIRRTLADRKKATEPLFRSNFEEVEARLQVGEKGLPTLPWMDRARAALANLKASFSRHFPALETTRDGVHVVAHELLLGAERSGNWAKAMAADQLVTVVKGLSKGDVQTMARKLAMDDILKDIDAGLYNDGNVVPFYGLDAEGNRLPLSEVRERVETDLATANAAIQSAPSVAAATERRAAIAQALTTRLVEIDALPESVLDDPRYFHRQVLSYAHARLQEQMAHPAGVGSPREVRNRKRGFQRRRVGGGEFNLAYQESEYEWIANAYQVIALHDILTAMKQVADITPTLKAEANALNLQAFYDRTLPEGMTRADLALNPKADPLLPFRQRIARAMQTITKLIARGEVTVAPHYAHMVEQLLDAEENGERFSHPQYWGFLSSLVASEQGEATVAAASIFKAIHDRKALIETTLGRDFIDPKNPDDLLELAPAGYRTWQPEKGMLFYSALTIAEKAVIEGTVGNLEGEAFRRALVMGGMKPTWIIPTGIAMTMDSLTPSKGPANAFDAVVTGEVKLWKQWTLLSPLRALKYNFNNLAGDFDAALLAPGVLRHVKDSARDLWQYMRQRQTDGAVARELQEAIRLGVVDQGQAAAEIPDVVTLPGLEALANASPSAFTAAIAFYWKHARGLTTWRENVLRLAAYRYFQRELRAGRRHYAASNRARVDGLRGINEKAALLARDLVGDYGNITIAGEVVRDRIVPFYSWLEINAKRYVNYFRNLPYEEEGASAAAGRAAAAIATRLGLKAVVTGVNLSARFAVGAGAAAAFLVLIAAWNAFMHPEEWEEMRRTGREGQLILGRRDDGTIISIRVEGAFADFLGWVGMKDIAADIRDVASGKMGYGDLLKDAAKAPVSRLLNGLEPTTKSFYQFFTGKSLYPDPFNPRMTRDPLGKPYGVFFDQWSIGWAYRQVVAPLAGAPKVPSRPGNPLLGLLLYQTDAGELAYQNVRSQAIEWREKHGKEQGAGDPTARSNALYWFKKSAQWGEDEAAQAWLQRYYQLGGTAKDVGQAMKRAHPLGVLAQKDQRAFQLSRSPAELEQLDRATDWYRRVMLSEGANAVRGTPRPAPATTGPSWIDRYRTQLQKPTTR